MAEIFHMAFTGISHAFHRVAPSSETIPCSLSLSVVNEGIRGW